MLQSIRVLLAMIGCVVLLAFLASSQERLNLAVSDIERPENVSAEVSAYIYDVMMGALVKSGKFNVISRNERDEILREVGYQQTGTTDPAEVVEIGRQLNVHKMIFGKIHRVFGEYSLTLKIIDVERATVERTEEESFGESRKAVREAAVRIARKIAGISSMLVPREMILIPADSFTMGSESGNRDEQPTHAVFLDAFSIDQFEVTNAQYWEFLEATRRRPPKYWGDPRFNRPDQPVVGVTWMDARDYCRWAEKRLPTEAEWEKAARGTDGRRFPWGTEPPNGFRANFRNETGHPVEVGSYEDGLSFYGVHDMAGNISEWVRDWYDRAYYSVSPDENPRGPSKGSFRVIRGGSWRDFGANLRSSIRRSFNPMAGRDDLGVRCARDVE